MIQRLFLALLLLSGVASAGVVRVDVQSREDVLAGQSFGAAGPYERLVGKVYFAIDPSSPANQMIADIDKAARNAQGNVEFSADLYVFRPKNPDRGNGAVLFEVSNRGGKGMLGMFNHAQTSEFGDGFLMRNG